MVCKGIPKILSVTLTERHITMAWQRKKTASRRAGKRSAVFTQEAVTKSIRWSGK